MFGLGLWEIVIIGVVALLVLGPQKLPQVGAQVARFLREFRRATSDIQDSFNQALYEDSDPQKIVPLPRAATIPAIVAEPNNVPQDDAAGENAQPAENEKDGGPDAKV